MDGRNQKLRWFDQGRLNRAMNNILQLSTCDHGGAGKAALRLHRNICSAGLNSKMVVYKKREVDGDIFEVGESGIGFRLATFLTKVKLRLISNQDYYFQDQSRSALGGVNELIQSLNFKPDVIIIHWVSNFISPEDIMALSMAYDATVILYLLDMAPLTGGCHYAWDCSGYMRECGMCPALKSSNASDMSHRIWMHKLQALRGIRLAVAAGSSWLEQQSKKSSLFSYRPIQKILLSVDSDIFKPAEKVSARQKLGLPLDKKIIFFGNQGIGLKRKGMSYLIEALQLLTADPDLDKTKFMIAIAGDQPRNFNINIDFKSLGFLGTDELLALAYQAADVFVCPSVEDSGPMMINESIMCGTPVVSFEMGVAPDLVHTGITGYCAKLKDSKDLARGIMSILSLGPEEAMLMSRSCRDIGMALCHPQIQVDALMAMIKDLTNTNFATMDK